MTSPGGLASAEATRITSRTAVISVAAALFLCALKGWSYWQSGSVAMLASLADSALDLAASAFTFAAVRYAAAPPDREHRYGHGKAEAFAGLVQAGLVAVSCFMIVLEAGKHLARPHVVRDGVESLIVMAVSLGVTALVMWAQTRALRQTGSIATAGDRAHYASDFASNIAVMIGIAGAAFFGVLWLDAVAGLAVAAWLAWSALHIARGAADQLLDRELPDADRARIRELAMEGGDIRGVHALRTRASGAYVHVQFHADLDPKLSLVEAHERIVAAEARIRSAYPAADVLIHADPANATAPHGHEDFGEDHRTAHG